MREIKFRAWSKGIKAEGAINRRKYGEWVFPPQMLYDERPGDCLVWKSQGQDIEVMQYTGLKDRNGKEIYEGDIVKQAYHAHTGNVHDGTDMTFDGHHIGEVVITAYKGVCLKNPIHYSIDTDETSRSNVYKQVASYRSEVIGNIYENQSLLGDTGGDGG